MDNIQIGLDVFITMMIVEVIVKPVAIRIGKYLLAKADNKVKWIPDWLYVRSRD